MARSLFDSLVAARWSGHFGCSERDLDRAGSAVVPRGHLAGSGAIHLTHIWARSFAELDPSLHEEFGQALLVIAKDQPLTAALIEGVIPPTRVLSVDHGLIFHLEPRRLVDHIPNPPFERRPLEGSDASALLELFDACQPNEVDDAFVAVDHEIAFGVFEGRRLVAAGSGYRRNGFMDLGEITHPAYRGRRLAPAIVAALSQQAMGRQITPQYRCDVTNTSSSRVAEVCGFTRFFVTESLHIAPA
jgi:hypothetical protein